MERIAGRYPKRAWGEHWKCGPSCHCHNCRNVLPSDEVPSTSGFTRGKAVTPVPFDSEESDVTDSDSDQSTVSESIETEIISDMYYEHDDLCV